MKALLRLYPRSWRKRYGREMEVLLDDLPGEIRVSLDLLLGAAAAYATVVRANRVLSAAGAYLHGVCVAVLLQAIAFVAFILFAESSTNATEIQLGPVLVASFIRPVYLHVGPDLIVQMQSAPLEWLPAACVLAALLTALAVVVAAPRLLRTVR
jgi:hypothetical protein